MTTQPGFFSKVGDALGSFFSPPTAPEHPIPASLYDQASDAAAQHILETYSPTGDVLKMAETTPTVTTPDRSTAAIAKGLGQGLARIPAEFAITAGQAGLSLHDMASGSSDLLKSDAGVPTTGLSWLLGDQPIKGYASQILDLSEQIQRSPFAQSLGLDKHSLSLAFAGIVGSESLNFTGAGGEEGAIKALAGTTDVGQTMKILGQIGVHEDLIPSVAEKLAPLTDPAAIKDALALVDTLQKTTTLTQKIVDHAGESVVPDTSKLADVRDALAKNLETATGAKRAAIQSQIDLIDTQNAAPPAPQTTRMHPAEAAYAYEQKFLDPANENGTIAEISGDEIKKLNGEDYAPENSRAYSVEAYHQAEDQIVNGPKKDIVMLGGGAGAGKSEIVGKQLKSSGFNGLLYDTTLSNYEGTKHLIDLANDAGKHVEIHAVLQDPERARFFTLMREIETGRPVVDDAFARSHAGFVDTLTRLIQNGDIAPEDVHLIDARTGEAVKANDPLATLKESGYTEENLQSTYAKETIQQKYQKELSQHRERIEGGKRAQQDGGHGHGQEQKTGIQNVGTGVAKQVIVNKIPLPKTVGELISTRAPKTQLNEGLDHAIPRSQPETAPRVPLREVPQTLDRTSPQSTTQKVDLSIHGTETEQRVRNAIARSQSLQTQIVNRGQEAYLAGRGLSDADLAIIRDGYQGGSPIENIAKKTSNPVKATQLINKIAGYYDYELAADRAAGADTPRVERYLPQYWDLSNPIDKTRWDEIAKQKGLKPNYGFRSSAKVFKSYAEGISAGFRPLRQNILEDLKANYSAASTAIGRQALKKGLHEAAPSMIGMSGYGMTPEGKPFVNSNIPGLEGLSYHPGIHRLLKGFQPLNSPDFINLVKSNIEQEIKTNGVPKNETTRALAARIGAEKALEKVGVLSQIDKLVMHARQVPKSAKEAGFTGVLGSIYDHVTSPMKQVLWNWSGFHSLNITLSHMGASTLHPITGAKGVIQSVGAAVSERAYNAVVDGYKDLMVAKDAAGKPQSVFDWAVDSGAFEARGLPALGAEHFHPFAGGHRAIFDREIPVLQLNLAEQAARKGIVATSPEGIALGKEIRAITGEINAKTMNINPNTLKVASRAFLAPGFTFSKYKTLLDSVGAWGMENGAAGALARQAVIGKSAIIGVAATLGTVLATGKFPNLQQLLMNFTYNPSVQTNFTNPKERKLDITFPKTFLAEGASAIMDPVAYGNARLNPLISDMLKLYTNQDYYGRPLVDPNVNTSTALQLAQNLGIGHLPIGAQAVVNSLMNKQTKLQGAIAVGGLGTHVSPSDPVMVKYAGVDHAIAQIADIAPDDPDRHEKMQAIFNGMPAADRKSLAYQELLAGVSTKGIYQSDVEQKYFQVQDLLQRGDTAGATAITKAMSKQDYQTYRSIKTRLAHTATFQKVKDLVASGDMKDAAALTGAMDKQTYASYQTWKKTNP